MNSNRRQFVKNLGGCAAGISLASPFVLSSCVTNESMIDDEQILLIGDDIAVANTAYGKVRGYILRNIFYFLGIPYGADTSGANRFMPPKKPDPWSDVYPAIWWGNTAPQPMDRRYANKIMSFRDHWNYDDVSEDCLRINIFTPGYNDGKKRPVLLWMHGGAMRMGNGIEQDSYNGENLARMGDVVFCSVNHRLGPLGFSNFSEVGGEKYASSGNVGMLDLVAALQWIKDNIENFGGDSTNVTIMGQSGGGKKVCATTCMPAAKGLFHKAVVLSGVDPKIEEKELSRRLGKYIFIESGLEATEIDKLQQMPWREYYDLAVKAAGKLAKDIDPEAGGGSGFFEANVDDRNIPQHPFFPEASPACAEIPMIICSVFNEDSPSFEDASLETISFEGVKQKLTEKGRGRIISGLSEEKAEEVLNAYRNVFPAIRPIELWAMIESHRQRTVSVADVKMKQPASVYTAWFGWHPPLFDNRIKSFHTLDICFWLNNTDLMYTHTGGGSRPRALSQKMAGYLVQFMKTGNPNRNDLPEWSAYSSDKGETMILDDVCELKNDPDREARKTLPPYI